MKGIVVKSTGSWYTVLTDEKRKVDCRIKGNFRNRNIKTTNPIAVGDKIEFEPEPGKDNGVITKIESRKNYIIRKSINLSKQTHILASNIDRAFLIVTLSMPATSAGFMDRFLVTAEAYQVPVTLVFNKMDIYSEAEKEELRKLVSVYEKIGYQCLSLSALRKEEVTQLKELMKKKTSLFAGHSGAGKSTLINSLDNTLRLKTAAISGVHHKGTHTTTSAEMYELEDRTFIIDTPGIKELSLVDLNKNELGHYFPEIQAVRGQCKFNNCVHINEPGCAVIEMLNNNAMAASRYDSYLGIMKGEELEKKYD